MGCSCGRLVTEDSASFVVGESANEDGLPRTESSKVRSYCPCARAASVCSQDLSRSHSSAWEARGALWPPGDGVSLGSSLPPPGGKECICWEGEGVGVTGE